jgi:hypothetical protein
LRRGQLTKYLLTVRGDKWEKAIAAVNRRGQTVWSLSLAKTRYLMTDHYTAEIEYFDDCATYTIRAWNRRTHTILGVEIGPVETLGKGAVKSARKELARLESGHPQDNIPSKHNPSMFA